MFTSVHDPLVRSDNESVSYDSTVVTSYGSFTTRHIDFKHLQSSFMAPHIPATPDNYDGSINDANNIQSRVYVFPNPHADLDKSEEASSLLNQTFARVKSVFSQVSLFRAVRPSLQLPMHSPAPHMHMHDHDMHESVESVSLLSTLDSLHIAQSLLPGNGGMANDHDERDLFTLSKLNALRVQVPTSAPTAHTQTHALSTVTSDTDMTETSAPPHTYTADLAAFQLYGTMQITPCAIKKSSFRSVRAKHNSHHHHHQHASLIRATNEETYAETVLSFLPNKQTPKMSMYQTIFTIINVYVNNSILFNPYAMSQGGCVSILIFGCLCLWLCYSSKLMLNLLSQIPPTLRTFPGFVLHTMGHYPCCVVVAVVILENVGRTILVVLQMWYNLWYLLEYDIYSEDTHKADAVENEHQLAIYIALACSIGLVIPAVCMLSFGELVIDSVLGFISTAFLSLLIVANYVMQTTETTSSDTNSVAVSSWSTLHFWPQSVYGLSVSCGIFIANLAGHACLPNICAQMEDATQFDYCVNVSWVIIFVIHATTAVVGYLTYGEHTDTLITQSMMANKDRSSVMPTVCTVCMILNLFVHIPIGVQISCQLPESLLQCKHRVMKRLFRLLFFFIIVALSWMLSDHMAILSAVMGSILTLTISNMPIIGQLQWKYLMGAADGNVYRYLMVFVMFCSVILSGFMLFVDTRR